jgi:uncharacterized protein (TIGR02186 family)
VSGLFAGPVAAALAALAVLGQTAASQPVGDDPGLRRGEGAPLIAAGLAEESVDVQINYAGARVVAFATSPALGDPAASVAVALIGPAAPHTVRRNVGGRPERFVFVSAPAVFSIGVEPQLAAIASEIEMINAGLNASSAAMPHPDRLLAPDLQMWRNALVDLKLDSGLYSLDRVRIERLEGGLVRATIDLPASAPPGDYRVRAVLFRDGERVARTDLPLTLKRAGLEATLFDLARDHGVVYGFLAVLLGAAIGGLGAYLARS